MVWQSFFTVPGVLLCNANEPGSWDAQPCLGCDLEAKIEILNSIQCKSCSTLNSPCRGTADDYDPDTSMSKVSCEAPWLGSVPRRPCSQQKRHDRRDARASTSVSKCCEVCLIGFLPLEGVYCKLSRYFPSFI